MRKATSISLIILMIAAMLHVSLATHYCGGKDVASIISLSGKLANCGMEGLQKELPPSGSSFTKHCCDDVVSYYGTDINYVPSFNIVSESFQYNFQVFTLPVQLSSNSFTGFISFYTDVIPPGVLMSTNVDLSSICVFRI